jgi:hypothetical protein
MLTGSPEAHSSETGRTDRRSVLVLPHARIAQVNDHFCGPATAQMLVRSRIGAGPGQADLGERMAGPAGTDRTAMRDTLTAELGREYTVRTLAEGEPLTQAQRAQLFTDVRAAADAGYGIALCVLTQDGGPRPSWFPDRPGDPIDHWLAVFGYDVPGERILVADPAVWGLDGLPPGTGSHWIAVADLARYTKVYVY